MYTIPSSVMQVHFCKFGSDAPRFENLHLCFRHLRTQHLERKKKNSYNTRVYEKSKTRNQHRIFPAPSVLFFSTKEADEIWIYTNLITLRPQRTTAIPTYYSSVHNATSGRACTATRIRAVDTRPIIFRPYSNSLHAVSRRPPSTLPP